MRLFYKLVNRKPVPCKSLLEAGFEDDFEKTRRVAFTKIGAVEVSTVFLSINHQYGKGPPILFETHVFGGALDGETNRYSTWEEAVAGHKKMVAACRVAAKPEKASRPKKGEQKSLFEGKGKRSKA